MTNWDEMENSDFMTAEEFEGFLTQDESYRQGAHTMMKEPTNCSFSNRPVKADALNPTTFAWHYNASGGGQCEGSYAEFALPFEAEQAARDLGISNATAHRLRREIK